METTHFKKGLPLLGWTSSNYVLHAGHTSCCHCHRSRRLILCKTMKLCLCVSVTTINHKEHKENYVLSQKIPWAKKSSCCKPVVKCMIQPLPPQSQKQQKNILASCLMSSPTSLVSQFVNDKANNNLSGISSKRNNWIDSGIVPHSHKVRQGCSSQQY